MVDQPDVYKVTLLEHGNMSVELTEFTYQGAWTSDEMIAKKRDQLVKTLAAYAKLNRFVQTASSKDAFMKARFTVFPKAKQAEAEAHWNYIQKYKPYAENLIVDEERIKYMQELNVEAKRQKAVLPYKDVADMSLAKDALALLDKKK